MSKRKHLCLLISNINELRSKRVLEGIKSQCLEYGYDLSVFSIKDTLSYYEKVIIEGAANIYNLIHYELFDGVIVDTLNFTEDSELMKKIFARIKERYKGPVVTITSQYDDYPVINGQNDDTLREMCRHMVEYHHYSKICILTGPKDNPESEKRLDVFQDELGKYRITVKEEHIIYGDFWYNSGEKLADRIAAGEIERPEAVICASDHMGIGLINQLAIHGIKVPEDIAVIGFEGTLVSKLNPISLTSYESNDTETAAMTVDYLRKIVEPDKEIRPYKSDVKTKFCFGRSCGCKVDSADFVREVGPYLYQTDTNYNNVDARANIGVLLESYCYEDLSSATDLESCIDKIVRTAYFVKPYETLYLCLKEDWIDISADMTEGYPDKMKLVVKRNYDDSIDIGSDKGGLVFSTKEMLPQLFDEREEPIVFYFTAVHFNNVMFGYSVVKRNMTDKPIDIVYKNWLRFVCSSLEMTRAKNMYMMMSVRDSMTGLYNRRGMYDQLESMLMNLTDAQSVYVAVIDMDGLKYINDAFGHKDGDYCIIKLASIISSSLEQNEIAVRAGGDEFFVVGVGEYNEASCDRKKNAFLDLVNEKGKFPDRPYDLSASIGSVIGKHENGVDIEELITKADEIMYRFKVARKKNRDK